MYFVSSPLLLNPTNNKLIQPDLLFKKRVDFIDEKEKIVCGEKTNGGG